MDDVANVWSRLNQVRLLPPNSTISCIENWWWWWWCEWLMSVSFFEEYTGLPIGDDKLIWLVIDRRNWCDDFNQPTFVAESQKYAGKKLCSCSGTGGVWLSHALLCGSVSSSFVAVVVAVVLREVEEITTEIVVAVAKRMSPIRIDAGWFL